MTTTAYITHPSFLKHEMGEDHPECPARLDAINDHLLSHGFLDLMPAYQAPEVTREQLLRAHTAHYLAEIEDHLPVTGYTQVDPDTRMNPFSLIAARPRRRVLKGIWVRLTSSSSSGPALSQEA